MNSIHTLISKACDQLDIEYELIHKDKIALKVYLKSGPRYFVHFHKAFNREDLAIICKDKDLSYTELHKIVNVPKWKSYLDPQVKEKYKVLARFSSNSEIVHDIESKFNYPFIIKANRLSQGRNVFLCQNSIEAEKALTQIFNRDGEEKYDYVAISQEYIDIAHEYRAIMYKGELLFMYEKDKSKAKFNGNLSPLHWENAQATLISDTNLIDLGKDFANKIYTQTGVQYAGIDIAIDKAKKAWLIEVNHQPGFSYYIKDNGPDEVIKMFTTILSDLNQ